MNIDIDDAVRAALKEHLILRLTTDRDSQNKKRLRVTLQWDDERIDSDWIDLEDLQP